MKRICPWLFFIFLSLNNYCNAQVTITGSIGLDATYATLNAAFSAFNSAAVQTGANILLNITGDLTEPAISIPLVYKNWTSLTIQPTGARTIGGNPTSYLIGLRGTRYVTINGLNSGGNTLTINTAANRPAIFLYNGASNNIIKNCTIKSNIGASISGVIAFSNSFGGGNNNNTIESCDISPNLSGDVRNLIYSNGAAGDVNKNDTIRNCTLHDNFIVSGSDAILLDANNDSWVIENNHFYQSVSRDASLSNAVFTAININGCLGDNFKINNNNIGGTSVTHTGYTIYGISTRSPSFKGIVLNNVGPASPVSPSNSYITNNTISGVQVNSSKSTTTKGQNIFVAIEVNNGANTDPVYITNNTIGGSGTDRIRIEATTTTANVVPCIGIYNRSSKGNFIEYNNIGSVSMYQTGGNQNNYFLCHLC